MIQSNGCYLYKRDAVAHLKLLKSRLYWFHRCVLLQIDYSPRPGNGFPLLSNSA